jgi:hypothetical protein
MVCAKEITHHVNRIMHRANCNAHRANRNQLQTLRMCSSTTGSSAVRCSGQQMQSMRTIQTMQTANAYANTN